MDFKLQLMKDEEAEEGRWGHTVYDASDVIPNPYLIKEHQELFIKKKENADGWDDMPFVNKSEEHVDPKINTKNEQKPFNLNNSTDNISYKEEINIYSEAVKENYDCDLCSSSFATLKEIFTHQRTKHANVQEDPEDKVLKAADKGSEGVILPSLYADASSHTLGSGFVCDKCNIVFNSYSALVFHTGRLHSQCPGSVLEILPEECAADLSASAGEFQRQLSSPTGHTNIVVEVVQTESSVKVQCSSSLECRSVETHTQNLSFVPSTQTSCTFNRCSQSVKFHDIRPSVWSKELVIVIDKESIKSHKTRKHHIKKSASKNSNVKTNTCNICNLSYSNLYSLKRHQVKHTSDGFKCPRCPLKFHYPDRLRRHMGLKGPIKCDYCCASFGTNLSLKHHQVKVHKSMSSPFKRRRVTHKSSIISKQWATGSEGELADSVASIKLKPQGSKLFTTSTRLERGSECRSMGQRYKCEKCDRIFLQKSWLTSHMSKTHRKKDRGLVDSTASLKLKPRINCKECGKYIIKKYMKSHLNMHKPRREHTIWCTVCNLRFPRLDYLRDHLMRASRNARLQCRNCCETFVSEKNLTDHTKRQHIEHAHQMETR